MFFVLFLQVLNLIFFFKIKGEIIRFMCFRSYLRCCEGKKLGGGQVGIAKEQEEGAGAGGMGGRGWVGQLSRRETLLASLGYFSGH